MISFPPHPSEQSPTASVINSAMEDVQLIRLGKQDIGSFRPDENTSFDVKIAAFAIVAVSEVLNKLDVALIVVLLSLSSHQVSLSENLYGTAGGTKRIRG